MFHQAVSDKVCPEDLANIEAYEAESAEIRYHFDLSTVKGKVKVSLC